MSRMRIGSIEIPDADIFKILLDNFPDMIHSVDEKGFIVYANLTAEKLLGYSRDELLKMNVRSIYADEIQEQLEKGFTDLKEKGDKMVESVLKNKDGTKIPVEIRSFSIYDDQGNFLRTFSILRDLRKLKELQASLVHAGRLAAIGELASGVAHDINNPLTVILLSNEMMLRELTRPDVPPDVLNQRMTSLAKDINRASGSIQKLANHLRSFSRGMVEKAELMDLYTSVSDALFITKNKILSSRVEVVNTVGKRVAYVVACPNHLEQVFVNLIGNACDAMVNRPERKLTLSLEAVQRDGGEFWKCDVQDTGTGIPPEIMDDIFHSFFTTKEKGKGTGLGLSISRGIIKDLKGNIEVASVFGKGATFSVFLPKAEAPSPSPVPTSR